MREFIYAIYYSYVRIPLTKRLPLKFSQPFKPPRCINASFCVSQGLNFLKTEGLRTTILVGLF